MGLFTKQTEQQLKDRCKTLEVKIIELRTAKDVLEDEYFELKAEHDKLKRTKKIEEEEIAHKIRCREETVLMQKKDGIGEAARKADERVMKVKSEFQDKLTSQLEKRGDELRKMYSEILARLPVVDVKIGETTVREKEAE